MYFYFYQILTAFNKLKIKLWFFFDFFLIFKKKKFNFFLWFFAPPIKVTQGLNNLGPPH